MQPLPWLLSACLLLGGCALLPKTPIASPSSGGDQIVGVKYEKELTVSNDGPTEATGQGDASTGGGVGGSCPDSLSCSTILAIGLELLAWRILTPIR